jgi:hypothetical protein
VQIGIERRIVVAADAQIAGARRSPVLGLGIVQEMVRVVEIGALKVAPIPRRPRRTDGENETPSRLSAPRAHRRTAALPVDAAGCVSDRSPAGVGRSLKPRLLGRRRSRRLVVAKIERVEQEPCRSSAE